MILKWMIKYTICFIKSYMCVIANIIKLNIIENNIIYRKYF